MLEQYGAKNFLFKYDHAGRLISRFPTPTTAVPNPTETEGYTWDVQDQLRQVREEDGDGECDLHRADHCACNQPLLDAVEVR